LQGTCDKPAVRDRFKQQGRRRIFAGDVVELDLKEFSLTLAIGLAVAWVSWLALRCAWASRAKQLANLIIATGPRPAPLLFAAVALLAVGFIVEELSKNALAERDSTAFGPQFRRLMPSERYDRSRALAESTQRTDGVHTAACRRVPWDAVRSPTVTFEYTALGNDLHEFLRALAQGAATPGERSALAQWDRDDLSWSTGANPSTYSADCVAYVNKLSPLYYLAKNAAYSDDNFFKELQAIRVRYEFARSLCYVLMAGAYLIIIAFLAQNTITMWRDIGGGKTIISFLLAVVVALAAYDVVAFLDGGPICRSFIEPVFQYLGIETKGQGSCTQHLDRARMVLLPATFIYVVLYRTRRVWRRLGKVIRVSIDSVVPNPPVLKNPRERDAWNAVVIVSGLMALTIPVRLAYESDHSSFIKRAYAYYMVVRGDKAAASVSCKENGTAVEVARCSGSSGR
jgi:hypothetical protein